MKIETDTLMYLDRYIDFAHWSLPPYPYNKGIIAGIPIPKYLWKMNYKYRKEKEAFFIQHYIRTHIYAAGQMYILSRDVAHDVVQMSSHIKTIEYKEDLEDHDISLMAFLSRMYLTSTTTNTITDHHHHHRNKQTAKTLVDHPINFIMISQADPFWRHNIKIKDDDDGHHDSNNHNYNNSYNHWKLQWENEIQRQISIIFKKKRK